jgi:hypothetical protein
MEARDVLEHALSLDPERIDTAILICQLDEAEEKWAALSSSIGRYLTLDSRSDYATVMRTLQAFQFGDKASQERLVAPSLPMRVRQSGGIIYCRGREAEYG